ncbi:MAG: HAD family hydrolase [Erysipelotrichaceae bacterium]|nr:HAD family hydrolase [Erysipelotrichaceae bacterium]
MRDKKKVKLIVCDIDNTLIVVHQPMSERTKQAIRRLRSQGIYFGIASGRSLSQVQYMAKSWGFANLELLIGMNGCTLWDGIEQTIHEQFLMKKEWLKEIIALMEHYPTNNTLMYINDAIYYMHDDELMQASIKASNMPAFKTADASLFYRQDNAKIMFRVDLDTMQELEEYFVKHPNPYYQAVKTQPTMLEFCNKQVSKAYAMQKFCELHNLSLNEVMAFGDTSNDNEMLEASGWGVCLHNGSADTKAIADEITTLDCAQDGFADYIERFLQE